MRNTMQWLLMGMLTIGTLGNIAVAQQKIVVLQRYDASVDGLQTSAGHVENGIRVAVGANSTTTDLTYTTDDFDTVTIEVQRFEGTGDDTSAQELEAAITTASEDENVIAIVCWFSDDCQHASDHTDLFFIGVTATSESLTQNSNFFSVAPPNSVQAQALYQTLQSDQIERFVVLYEPTAYAVDLFVSVYAQTFLGFVNVDEDQGKAQDSDGNTIIFPKMVGAMALHDDITLDEAITRRGDTGEIVRNADGTVQTSEAAIRGFTSSKAATSFTNLPSTDAAVDAVLVLGDTTFEDAFSAMNTALGESPTSFTKWYLSDAIFRIEDATVAGLGDYTAKVAILGTERTEDFTTAYCALYSSACDDSTPPLSFGIDYGYDAGLFIEAVLGGLSEITRANFLEAAKSTTISGLTGNKDPQFTTPSGKVAIYENTGGDTVTWEATGDTLEIDGPPIPDGESPVDSESSESDITQDPVTDLQVEP